MNALAQETSPYLLQHAHNPVNWQPWGPAAFQKAEVEKKLVIVSIGYSACHWCHVMEHESFEDEQVAKLMNDNFISIKVDREERPDVDGFYMDAAQLMTGRGGWPLNAIALPDGRPVYAGTYFPKIAWMGVLKEISFGYRKQPEKYLQYAAKLVNGIKSLAVTHPEKIESFGKDDIDEAWRVFTEQFDRSNGGRGRAPKFPMPDNWLFALRYAHDSGDEYAMSHTMLTLNKMAEGGIYDQIGGGFARYSTDGAWKVPHFEKMLYDNAQLVSLYSEGYRATGNEMYQSIASGTINFVKRELTAPEGGFYGALDADSEGIEGKFYVWTEAEIEDALGSANPNTGLVKDYFGIGKEALWEEGKNVLLVASSMAETADKYNIDIAECKAVLEFAKQKLFDKRSQRPRPGLDDKILLSWNALMSIGLLDAYAAFGEPLFLSMAEDNLRFTRSKMVNGTQLLRSYKNGTAKIPAFLDDYALYIKLLLAHYQTVFDEPSLIEAKTLTDFVLDQFKDNQSALFWYTQSDNQELAAKKLETSDNVIASSNSVMAHNLFVLGKLFYNDAYIKQAKEMLSVILPSLLEQPAYYSNWALLLANFIGPFYEIGFTGKNAVENLLAFSKLWLPNKCVSGTHNSTSAVPALQGKLSAGQSLIYVCEGKVCQKPVGTVAEAVSIVLGR